MGKITGFAFNLPGDGVRAMCRWERFCAFAREPERRSVGLDCRLTVAGVAYEVDPELAGETVVVWWGLFDQELFVEHGDDRYGPYDPIGGPVPLHRYRRHRKSRREARAERTRHTVEVDVRRNVADDEGRAQRDRSQRLGQR